MRRAVLLLVLVAGCKSPERRFLDGRDRENAREGELVGFPRQQREAFLDMSTWPASNGPGPFQTR
jgi:hypothetical protein